MSRSTQVYRRNRWLEHLSLAAFIAIHVSCLLAFAVPFSWELVWLALGGYVLRMWGLTAGYHRYFAHRAYKTSRFFQFVLAWVGAMAVQKGPLWWASWHRVHHKYSDQPGDVHSPVQRGFWYAHMGWFIGSEHDQADLARVKDFARYPELHFIDRYYWLPPATYALGCWLLAGFPGLVWGFSISTVLLWHGTFTINSLAHTWGWRRYETTDTSRNNPVLALITLGEGWHNNHHYYMNSANQGFFWWEFDISYYTLRVLSWLGVVWDVRRPPRHVLDPVNANVRFVRTRLENMFAEVMTLKHQVMTELGTRRAELLAQLTTKREALLAELNARRETMATELGARWETMMAELERMAQNMRPDEQQASA